MKPVLTAVVAIVLGSGCTSLAQTMVEYSNLAGKGVGAPKALSSKINSSNEKIAAATGAADSGSQGSAAKATAQTRTTTPQAEQEQVAKPTPPAVFILSNGERVESNHYILTTDGVRLQDKGGERTIPTKELNVNATMTANNERGLHLVFPTSTSQITLSF